MYLKPRTEFLAARFYDISYIQCIFQYKLSSQRLRSIIEYLFYRRPRDIKGLSAFIYTWIFLKPG